MSVPKLLKGMVGSTELESVTSCVSTVIAGLHGKAPSVTERPESPDSKRLPRGGLFSVAPRDPRCYSVKRGFREGLRHNPRHNRGGKKVI